MKNLIAAILALAAVAILPAEAAPWRDYRGGRMDTQAERQPRPGGYQRQQPQREMRRPERQPERDYRQPERLPERDYRQPERRPDGRLTDEERRDLRRDLDRANREIYRGR